MLLPGFRILLLFALRPYLEVELLLPCLLSLLLLIDSDEDTVLHQSSEGMQASNNTLLEAQQLAVPTLLLSLLPLVLECLVEGQVIGLLQQHLIAYAELRVAVAQTLKERDEFVLADTQHQRWLFCSIVQDSLYEQAFKNLTNRVVSRELPQLEYLQFEGRLVEFGG